MKLNELQPAEGSRFKRLRKGRGLSSATVLRLVGDQGSKGAR